ncbi:MAG: asparagine synthetase B, partial [Anaerolineae bacterium]|nr:asparagine synthetase B [Anaerolineae bacterium]
GYSTLQAHRLAGPYRRLVPAPLRQHVIPALINGLPTSFNNISLDFKLKRFAGAVNLPLALRHQQWLGSFTSAEKQAILTPAFIRTEAETFTPVEQKLNGCKAHDPLNRVLYLDMKMYMEGDILPKVDRASMSASLEVRVPLLNHLVLDYAARLPLRYKLNRLRTKYILRRAVEGVLPEQIWKRGKKGFNVPVARWIAGPLREMAQDMLHPDRLQREGFFQPEAVQVLLNDHLAHRRDARKLLWTLLTFQMWHAQWAR